MSTLLKKKYCKERDISSAEEVPISDSIDVSDKQTKPGSIPTITDEDNSLDEVRNPLRNDRVKSVRFDLSSIIIINAATFEHHTEKKLHYCDDVWYKREDYRNFWRDRLNSVRLWKLLQNQLENDEANKDFVWKDQEYTIRGLENHIYSSTQILNRQRDLYSVLVFQDPYDAEGIRMMAHDWSQKALHRAQKYALQDAADVHKEAATLHQFSERKLTFPTESPSSPSSVTSGPGNSKKRKASFIDIAEMNKRLIEQHVRSRSTIEKKIQTPKRQPTASSVSTNSKCVAGRSNFLRRFSTSSAISHQQRQPLSLRFHASHQRRRLSLAEDFNQHMEYCNRAVNELPLVARYRHHHRDSLRLSSTTTMIPPDKTDQQPVYMKQGFRITGEGMMYQPVRRDSLHLACSNRSKTSIPSLTGMLTPMNLSRTISDTLPIQDSNEDFKRHALTALLAQQAVKFPLQTS